MIGSGTMRGGWGRWYNEYDWTKSGNGKTMYNLLKMH